MMRILLIKLIRQVLYLILLKIGKSIKQQKLLHKLEMLLFVIKVMETILKLL
nr:MAG TPA: hypothetical protein [Caudoviricetes sp.]